MAPELISTDFVQTGYFQMQTHPPSLGAAPLALRIRTCLFSCYGLTMFSCRKAKSPAGSGCVFGELKGVAIYVPFEKQVVVDSCLFCGNIYLIFIS